MRLVVTIAVLGLLVATFLTIAYASHNETYPIVKEKQIIEGSQWAAIFHDVEKCAGLTARLPRLARTEGAPCPWDPALRCVGADAPFGGQYLPCEQTIVLPFGRHDVFRHEAVHHLKWINQGDISHDGPEWECQ